MDTFECLVGKCEIRTGPHHCRTCATGGASAATEFRQIPGFAGIRNRLGRSGRGVILMIRRCSSGMRMAGKSIGACSSHAFVHRAAKQHRCRRKSLGGNCQHYQPHQRCFQDSPHTEGLVRRFPNWFKSRVDAEYTRKAFRSQRLCRPHAGPRPGAASAHPFDAVAVRAAGIAWPCRASYPPAPAASAPRSRPCRPGLPKAHRAAARAVPARGRHLRKTKAEEKTVNGG